MSDFIETAEELRDLDDLEIVEVTVKTWKGKKVRLRMPSMFEGLELKRRMSELTDDNKSDGERILLRALLVDSDGKQLIKTDEQFNWLYQKNPQALDEIQDAALKLVVVSKAEEAKGKEGSPETGPASSPTD